jgi:hypothetical protein
VVTTRAQNLYVDLLEMIGHSDTGSATSLFASACRMTKRESEWILEAWPHTLELGRPLPTVPLWLADNLAVPLEFETSYEQSCAILNIP